MAPCLLNCFTHHKFPCPAVCIWVSFFLYLLPSFLPSFFFPNQPLFPHSIRCFTGTYVVSQFIVVPKGTWQFDKYLTHCVVITTINTNTTVIILKTSLPNSDKRAGRKRHLDSGKGGLETPPGKILFCRDITPQGGVMEEPLPPLARSNSPNSLTFSYLQLFCVPSLLLACSSSLSLSSGSQCLLCS